MDGRHSRSIIILQKSLLISKTHKQDLIKFAKEAAPNESCAVLLGTFLEGHAKVKELYFTKNIEESPVNFTVSNEDLLKVYKLAEEKKLEVICIFHSHPNSKPYPSLTDEKFMLVNPVIWLIYSGILEEMKAFVLDSTIQEIPVIIS